MNEAAKQALASFQHHQALSIFHAKKAEPFLAQFLSITATSTRTGEIGTPTGQSIRCVRIWTKWLGENGPAIKSDIAEATGVRFNERGTAHTFLWDDDMVYDADDVLPPSALMRIQSLPQPNRGRPPMIYFLWSQRFDVRPLFGVGPEKPQDVDPDGESETLLGVTMPPDSDLGLSYSERMTMERPLSDADQNLIHGLLNRGQESEDVSPQRYDTIEEWNAAHSDLFDRLAQYGAKPTDEERDLLGKTLPEGVEYGPSIAMAYSEAVKRSRSRTDV